jgi:hypothetical protein
MADPGWIELAFASQFMDGFGVCQSTDPHVTGISRRIEVIWNGRARRSIAPVRVNLTVSNRQQHCMRNALLNYRGVNSLNYYT